MHDTEMVHLGDIYVTPAVQFELGHDATTYRELLAKHQHGEWGDVSQADLIANEKAVVSGARIRSAYHLENGVLVWIVSELARQITTILLPEEYRQQ